ncbi:hypothetical protein SOD_c35980 [Serratia plymuthica 4Rx13]|uniref:Lipoprotein n=1 Tax=Serratia plymuthica TaxID=82996 RepID=A0A318NTH7_SERPL|nr:hypothetical protein [Serratia plymuthica]AGO56556.1 hypothetical protein SOD_c35980 [Serratia plymuthica 4Rx13]PYD37169.1 hypothetical protein CT690_19880 [Serratia plymuthica]
MMRKLLYIIAVTTVLSGCSTSAVPPSKAIQAPPDRIFKYQKNESGYSRLTVVRDSGLISGGCYATVYINSVPVAKLNPKEKASFYLPNGEWIVGAAIEGKGLCGSGGERQERYISIKNMDDKVVRVFSDESGNIDIRPTTIN